jgi:hypothetical protein
MDASSPKEKAAAMVYTPAKTQAASNQPGLPRMRDIPAGTMKMPEPIMTPITIMVESNNPRALFGWRLA